MFPDPASIHPGDTCYPKRFDVIVWAAAPNRSGVVHGALMPVGCLSRAGNRATPSPSAPDVHLPDASGDILNMDHPHALEVALQGYEQLIGERHYGPFGPFRRGPMGAVLGIYGAPQAVGNSQASAMICTTICGGESPGATRAGLLLESREPLLEESLPPALWRRGSVPVTPGPGPPSERMSGTSVSGSSAPCI